MCIHVFTHVYVYIYIYIYIYVCVCLCVRACMHAHKSVYVCVCLQNVFHTLAMFCLFYCFIQLWAGRKTAIMAMPVP